MTANAGAINLYPCHDLACLQISGQDSVSFLQSQLTQDVQLLSQGRAALAGYCSAQGRLLASMILVPTDNPQTVLALLRRDLLDGLVKRLRMFVLRSKVVLEVRDDLRVWGLVTPERAPDGVEVPKAVWHVQTCAPGQIIRAPGSGDAQGEVARCWLIQDVKAAQKIDGAEVHADASHWHVLDVLAGLPWIEEATRDLFIPQTLNLDLIEGVSFTKGCYPGQEVVARTHYRAKVKRRMHAARVDGSHEIAPAADVFTCAAPDDPVGRVIQVARDGDQTYVLFEAPFKVIAEGPLCVSGAGAAQELTMDVVPLPYSTEEAAS